MQVVFIAKCLMMKTRLSDHSWFTYFPKKFLFHASETIAEGFPESSGPIYLEFYETALDPPSTS